MSTVLCPNCNRPLITKSGKFGAFLACPGYPLCKHTQKIVSSPKIESPKIQPQKTVKNWSVYQTAIFTACKETKDNMIISRTPLRISFAGGGSDIASFYNTFQGAVASAAINKYIYITVNKKFDNQI